MTTIIKEHFVRSVESRSLSHLKKTGGAWITKPFKNWKKAMEKMRAHSKSDSLGSRIISSKSKERGIFYYTATTNYWRAREDQVVSRRFFFVPIFLHGSTFLTLLILINWLIWSCPVVVKI